MGVVMPEAIMNTRTHARARTPFSPSLSLPLCFARSAAEAFQAPPPFERLKTTRERDARAESFVRCVRRGRGHGLYVRALVAAAMAAAMSFESRWRGDSNRRRGDWLRFIMVMAWKKLMRGVIIIIIIFIIIIISIIISC